MCCNSIHALCTLPYHIYLIILKKKEKVRLQHLPKARFNSWAYLKRKKYANSWCDFLPHFTPACSRALFKKKKKKKEGEKLGQQPWACCCHTDLLFDWFSPLPPCAWFLHSLSAAPSPYAPPSVLISLHLPKQSLLHRRSVQWPTLLCSNCFFFSFSVFSF